MKTFLLYLQLWIWNFAHFFPYIKGKEWRCFFIHPSLLSAARLLWRPGGATSFSCQNLPRWGWRRHDARACMTTRSTTRKEDLVVHWSLISVCQLVKGCDLLLYQMSTKKSVAGFEHSCLISFLEFYFQQKLIQY